MKTLLTLALLAAVPGLAAAQATKEDLKKLARAGISEDVILTFLRANGFEGRLSTDDMVELKAAGVGDRVFAAILEPGTEAPSTPPPEETTPSAPWPYGTEEPSTGTAYSYEYAAAYYPYYSYSYSYPYCYDYYPSYSFGIGFRFYWPFYYGFGSFCGPYYSSYCRPFFGSYYRPYCGPTWASNCAPFSGTTTVRFAPSQTRTRSATVGRARTTGSATPASRVIPGFNRGMSRPAVSPSARPAAPAVRSASSGFGSTGRIPSVPNSGSLRGGYSGSTFRPVARSSSRPSYSAPSRPASTNRSSRAGSSYRSSSGGSRSSGSSRSQGRSGGSSRGGRR